MKYIQKYNNDDKKPAKILILGICILFDLIVLAGIIACFSTKKYIDLIIYAVIFVITLAIRLASLFLTFETIISFEDGNFTIVKKYPIRQITLYQGKTSQLKFKKYDLSEDENGKKYVRLCSKSCEKGVYMIELSQRKYLIYLDDYLFSLIEANYDLS